MSKKYVFCLLLSFILFFLAVNAYAWDGQRKGFLLGFGIGSGFTSFTQKVRCHKIGNVVVCPGPKGLSVESDRGNKVGLMTDFKIGYAPDNSWGIYYTSKSSQFEMTNTLGNNVTIANGLGAVAVSYWFKPQAPSPFIAGGVGFSAWGLPYEENPDFWIGPGLFVGGGYEFSKHVSIEGYLFWGEPDKECRFGEVSSNAFSFMATLNVLGY